MRVRTIRPTTHPSSELASLVPVFVRTWVADDPDAKHKRLRGTVLVAEAHDRSDVPLLNDALSIATVRGGTILKFNGDRLVIFFANDDHARATARDIATRFHASVGIDRGDIDLFLVGCSHRELFVTGVAVGRALLRERSADAGEGPFLASSITEARRTEVSWPGGHYPGSFVPEAVRRIASSGGGAPETREMAVAFIHLANLDEVLADVGAETAAQHLCDLVTRIQRSFVQHEIAFVTSDVAIGGPTIAGMTGLVRTRKDDDARLLRALREITDYPSPIALHIGVDRGSVRCGFIGTESRRTFIAVGPSVTSAGELMCYAASSEILATAEVIGRTADTSYEEAAAPIGVNYAYRITKPTNHHRGNANMLLNLGRLAFEQNDLAAARHYYEAALALSRRLGFQSDEATVLYLLGHVALTMGDAELAMVRCDESLTIRRDLGDEIGVAETLALLGRARHADGDSASARVCWLHALEMLRAVREPAAARPSA